MAQQTYLFWQTFRHFDDSSVLRRGVQERGSGSG